MLDNNIVRTLLSHQTSTFYSRANLTKRVRRLGSRFELRSSKFEVRSSRFEGRIAKGEGRGSSLNFQLTDNKPQMARITWIIASCCAMKCIRYKGIYAFSL